MAVEASEGGGAGAGGEFIAKAELEAKKERELGGEFEQMECRDGEQNDGSGTDGSFVMVMSGGDSDERSDTSEKETELDVGGGGGGGSAGGAIGDPPAGSGAQPLEDISDSSVLADDERVEEGKGDVGEVRQGNVGDEMLVDGVVGNEELGKGGSPVEENEGKGDEEGVGGDGVDGCEEVEKIRVVEEKMQQVDRQLHLMADMPAAQAMTGETEEVISESPKTDHDQNEKDEVTDIDLKKVEEQKQNNEKVVAVEVSQKVEQIRIKEGYGHVIDLKDEKDACTEDFKIDYVLVIGSEEQGSEGIGDTPVQNEVKKASEEQNIEADLLPSTSSDPANNNVGSSATQSANKEVESASDIEEMNKDSDGRSADVDTSAAEKKEYTLGSEIERNVANDEVSEDQESLVIESTEDEKLEGRRNATADEIENIESSAACPANKEGDSNSLVDEGKSTPIHRSLNIEYFVTDHAEEDAKASSEIRDMSNTINYVSEGGDRKKEIDQDQSHHIQVTTTVHDCKDRELDSSAELAREHNVDVSDVKSAGEEREKKSFNELISDQAEDVVSATANEYQIAEASCTGQIPQLEKVDVEHSSSRAEESQVEELSSESNPHLFMEVSASEAVECQHAEASSIDLKPESKEEKGPTSEVEENLNDAASLVDSNHEFVKKHIDFTFKVKENQNTQVSSVDSNSEPVKEDVSSVSTAEENQDVGASITKSSDEKKEVQLVSEIPIMSEEEQDREGSEVSTVNQERDVKSDYELAESAESHPIKGLRKIEEQAKELKSEEEQPVVLVQTPHDIVASSACDANGEKAEMHTKKQQFYLIKVPRRVIDDELQARINEAQIEVEEKTQRRDFMKNEIQDMRKKLSDYCQKKDAAIEEEKKARALVNAKRKEMDSLQSVISKGKAAASFLDIISQIHSVEHQLQHETISLKEEKKYLHDLNQLKHERELQPCNKYSQSDIDEALKQKETAESSLRGLKKEFDILRGVQSKADGYAKSANKSYIEQFNKIKEHEQKWKTANEFRQNAYKKFQCLKSDKMEHFWKYLDDKDAAKKYGDSREIEALERHCMEQVERIMQLWNKDDEFRRQYVDSNVNSTLRRFRTLDGRTLNPNEEPVVLQSCLAPSSMARIPSAVVTPHGEIKSPLQAKQMVMSKLSSKSTKNKVKPVVVSMREESVEIDKKKKLTEEEEEQARLAEEQARLAEQQTRKEEEIRKEREAAELKEKLRMEQKAKAQEAEERKRRKAEKAQAKAEYKAQKEAEIREVKKAKKEKKENLSETTAGNVEGDTPITEIASRKPSHKLEVNSKRASRRSANQSALNKYSNRLQPVPIPLRNKGRKKTLTWVWTFFCAAAVAVLFFAGNYISFSDFSLQDFGF